MLTIAVFDKPMHRQHTYRGQAFHVQGVVGTECNWPEEADSSGETTLYLPSPFGDSLNFSFRLLPHDSGDLSPASIELTNRGRSLALSSGPRIHRGRTVTLELPLNFRGGEIQFELTNQKTEHVLDRGLTTLSQQLLARDESQRVSPGPETLAAWLETLSDLQKEAAGTKPLFELAAQAVFNPGGLDGCFVLQVVEGCWRIVASHMPFPDHGISFREDLVAAAVSSGETLYHDAGVVDREDDINDLHTAVVCPVIDKDSRAVAVIYAFRSLHRRNLRKGIRFLEAQFVQVVADSLSAGIIRLNSEAEAARSQVLLEQAFNPKIARQLQIGRDVLKPRNQEVTVLFADLRGFSSIAEQFGTQTTFDLLSDVMDEFSNVINDLNGVIIDFYGDGISAFWNAPIPQPEHAMLACQAAVEMLSCLPELNRRWEVEIKRQLQIGVGIHTGMASVGNSGSRTRMKYGPRGTTVNLASRLESLTKTMKVPVLISGSTAKQVEGAFTTTCLKKLALPGHQEEIEVYELQTNGPSKPFEKPFDTQLQQTCKPAQESGRSRADTEATP